MTAKRPERPCLGCRKRTTAKDQKCRTCRRPDFTPRDAQYAHALTGGQWVYVRGIARWVPSRRAA